jgi:hypothetical protein
MNRERETYQSLVDGDGAAVVNVQMKIQSPCNVAGRRGGGGVVNGGTGRRRAKVPEWRGSSVAERSLCSAGRR